MAKGEAPIGGFLVSIIRRLFSFIFPFFNFWVVFACAVVVLNFKILKRKGAQASLGTGGAIINSDGVRGISVWDRRFDGGVTSYVAREG